MSKKNITIVFIAIIASLAISNYCFKSNFYNEEQRLIYNAVLSRVVISRPLPIHTTSSDYAEEKVPYQKQLQALKDKSAPHWEVKVNKDFDLLNLPLEGLTASELVKRAELSSDADIYLYLASGGEFKYQDSSLFEDNLFHTLHQGKKWLEKAKERGRLGVDFLLQVLAIKEKELLAKPIRSEKIIEKNVPEHDACLHIVNAKGYEAFRELIRQGDFELYRTLLFFEPKIASSPLAEEMTLALTKEAKLGNKKAQLHLAELTLLPLAKMDIDRGVGEEKASEPWLVHYKAAIESSRELKKLADEGNISAMYLWLQYGLRFQDSYDSQTWRDIFKFTDTLIRKGYVGILRNAAGVSDRSDVLLSDFPWGILGQYYSSTSLNRVALNCEKTLRQRGDAFILYYLFLFNFDVLTNSDFQQYLGETNHSFLKIYGMHRKILECAAGQEDKKRVVDYLEKQAASGYPEAKLALGDIMKRGSAGVKDERRALSLFEDAWKDCRKYNSPLKVYSVESDQGMIQVPSSSTTAELAMIELMDLYLSDSSSVRDESRAFQLTEEYAKEAQQDSELQENRFFLLGQLYEKGLGTPQNKGMAIECYKKGVLFFSEPASCLSLERLYEHQENALDENIADIVKSSRKESPSTLRLKKILDTAKKQGMKITEFTEKTI